MSGPDIPNGVVLISGGKITAVGAGIAVPTGATVIDATGMNVYPGMMETANSTGLAEITEGANATVDNVEVGRINPNVQAFFGFDPHSAHVGIDRQVGITSVVTAPSGGLFSGQAAIMNLAGDTPPQMAVVPRVAMVIQLPGGGRGGRGGFGGAAPANGRCIRNARLDQAGPARRRSLRQWRRRLRPRTRRCRARCADVVLASLIPVVRGEMPVMIPRRIAGGHPCGDCVCEEMKVKPIIMGGPRGLSDMTDYLKQHNVSIVLTSTMAVPSREDDPYDVNYAGGIEARRSGNYFAIASGEENPDIASFRSWPAWLPHSDWARTTRSSRVTLWPAQIFGVGDKLGSIEVGKMATSW